MVKQDWNTPYLYIYIGSAELDTHILHTETSVFIHADNTR